MITIGEPHDQGLVFKWGSLVGISMPSEGANWSLPFMAADVEFRPAGFTGAINNLASVPYCDTDFAPYGDNTIDHLKQAHTPANIANGIGDICRYMGEVDGSQWRMPAAAEWAELYGSTETDKGQSVKLGNGWIQGNYYPLSGYAMGPNRDNVAITGSGAGTRVSNVNSYIDGAVFLPTSGYREVALGSIYNIGSHGTYWSSTASTASNGYRISFISTNVWPQLADLRYYAFSVRCIRE